jgi:hypothetical protein
MILYNARLQQNLRMIKIINNIDLYALFYSPVTLLLKIL